MLTHDDHDQRLSIALRDHSGPSNGAVGGGSRDMGRHAVTGRAVGYHGHRASLVNRYCTTEGLGDVKAGHRRSKLMCKGDWRMKRHEEMSAMVKGRCQLKRDRRSVLTLKTRLAPSMDSSESSHDTYSV